jgi:hypothetical protein
MIKLPISRKAVRCRDNAMLNKEGEQGGSSCFSTSGWQPYADKVELRQRDVHGAYLGSEAGMAR